MDEEREDMIVLVDENGVEIELEHLDTMEVKGNKYVVFLTLDEIEEDEEAEEIEEAEEEFDEEEYIDTDEIVILKVEENENDEDSFVTIEDEDELNQVFEEFKKRVEEEYEFDEE